MVIVTAVFDGLRSHAFILDMPMNYGLSLLAQLKLQLICPNFFAVLSNGSSLLRYNADRPSVGVACYSNISHVRPETERVEHILLITGRLR